MMGHSRLLVGIVFLGMVMAGSASAAQSEKATGTASRSAGKAAERQQAATETAKELLLLMDTDKTGKVSREEWMKFMEAEFDRLDVTHTGKLDVKELRQSRVRLRPAVGK